MTSSVLAPAPTGPMAKTGRMSSNVSLYLLASIVVAFLAASSAPTPLYAVYQARWGFSPITTTVVFAVYALAVLIALLTLGNSPTTSVAARYCWSRSPYRHPR